MTQLPIFCKEYFDLMDEYPDEFCKEQWALKSQIEEVFKKETLDVRLDLYEKYINLGKYLHFKRGYEWERFIIGLFFCVYTTEDLPRWTDIVVVLGRGAGKDGCISWFSLIGISPYNPVRSYDVDICAFNEDQALRPVKDVYDCLDENPTKMKKHFKWTKEKIYGLKNKGYIKGHTNNAKGKDGLRSGMVILNEIHTYESYDNIDIFTTGLGKKKDPRTAYFTTNGNVVDGPLDEILKEGREVLFEKKPDAGTIYFFCNLDDKEEVHDQYKWRKANPSLRYKPSLQTEIAKEYKKWKANPKSLPAFMTKRMNIRQTNEAYPAAEWEQIKATDKPIPYEDLIGRDCTVGIDFSKTTDWAGVNIHFKIKDKRYDINHAFVCKQSPELFRLRCPYELWAQDGHLTIVDAPEIAPSLIAEYIYDQTREYNVKMIALDGFRYTLMAAALEVYGFSTKNKNVKLYRKSDIMKVIPLIDRCFANEYFYWGNNPVLRWGTNNTKKVPSKKSALTVNGEDLDMGNYLYSKIEPKARKTDPFMALVGSMVVEEEILDAEPTDLNTAPLVFSF